MMNPLEAAARPLAEPQAPGSAPAAVEGRVLRAFHLSGDGFGAEVATGPEVSVFVESGGVRLQPGDVVQVRPGSGVWVLA